MYGNKLLVFVMSLKLANGCTVHYPGSISEVKHFRQNPGFQNEASKNYVRKLYYDNNGLFGYLIEIYWVIFADKGYQSASYLLCAIQPIQAPIRRVLTASQLEHGQKILLDRIDVKINFGRMTSL